MDNNSELVKIFEVILKDAGDKKLDIEEFQDEMKIIFEIIKKSILEDKDETSFMMLSDMYYYGIGTEKDLKLANKYYKLAVDNHTEDRSLAFLFKQVFCKLAFEAKARQDEKAYVENLENAFRFGGFLGASYLLGDHYLREDPKKAIEYLETGAKQAEQDRKCRHNFDKENAGNIYDELGVAYNKIGDYKKTVLNYKKGAGLGNGDSYYHIGELYLWGHIFEENFDEARDYLERALYYGSNLAKYNGHLFEERINHKK